ncbi:MAG: hypothetical protein H8E98_04650, partial [Bacteroidetes bacterium]|nr:hypothetical protein [Bacteroidota bacterium]
MATAGKIIAVNQLAKEKAAALKKLENDLKEQMGDIKNKLIREINSNIRKNDELALNSFYRNYETYYLETSDYYNDWKNNIESKYNYKRSDWMEAPSSQPQKKNKEKINVPMYKYYLIRAKEKHKIKRDGFNEIALKFTTSSIALNNKYADSYAFLSELKEDILEKYYYILIASSLNSRDKEINKTRERLKSEFGDKLFNAIDNENTTFISNALDKKLHLGIIKENGIEILPYAIIYDKPKSFELILKNTKNNYYPVNNETHKLFLMALKHDAVKCVEVLHKNKVDISYANNIKEKISLYYTIVNGSDKSAQFILENVADVEKNLKHAKNLDDEKSIFKISKIATQYYIKANKPEEIRVIFNYYPELYYIAYSDNDRMVEYAVTKSRVLVLDLFIEKGLDINLINPKTNKSLMQYAADYNRTFMYDYLKNKGYNIHAQMGDNGNLVNYAVETDNNDFLNFLLENKVSISCKGADGSTPISKSINHFLISNFQTLLKYCNEEDMAYALNCAIVANNKFFVVRALQNGVDPYKIAKSPLSVEMIAPYQLAKQFRNKKIINILNSYSCYYKRLPKKFNEISDSFFDLKNETEKTKYLDQLIFESIKEYNKRKDFITRKDYLKTSLNNYRIYKKHGLNIKNIDYAERKIEKLKYKLGRKSLGIAMLNKESKSTDSTSTTFYGIAVPLISEWAQHDRMFGVNTTIWEFYYGNLSGLALNPIIGAYNNFNGIGGAAMFVADKVNGISFGLFGGGADKVNGVIVCGIAGLTSNCNGIIITGGASVSEYGGVLNGIQISGLGNFGEGNYINVNGIQVSTIANLADNVKGIQIGIYNEASNLAGVQFGLWNNNGNFSFPFINIGFGGNNNKSKKENYKTIPYEMYKTNSEYGKWQIAKQNKIVRSNVIETKNQNDKFSLNKVISNENISDISKLLPGYNINVAFEDREIFNKKWKSVSKFTIKQELYTEDSDKPKVTITDTTIVQYIEFESTKKGIIIKLSEANQDEYIYNGKTHYIHSKSTIGSDEFKTESNVSSSLSFFKNAEG